MTGRRGPGIIDTSCDHSVNQTVEKLKGESVVLPNVSHVKKLHVGSPGQ
jgi:hypothetical protein